MNSAPQVQTAEISDAELDHVSGGLSPHVGVIAGPTAVGDSDVLAQAGAVQNEALGTAGQALGTAGQYHQAGVFVSF
ncbi:hypothetical protein ABZ876_05750 [Streptomyces sp. NPDC046931]|uniref:hypothetical protein n=1 Tax=Streptomyces sp. NPDC046931 TaxID=3154806 RepID=UPI0033C0F21A